MPPKPKTDSQREKDKQKIISAALDIIMEHGLKGLTMRKLGTKLHMSGANIYNYFLNKDELYIHILISGFDILNKRLKESVDECEEPLQKIEKLAYEFVRFGTDFPSYYELMFCTKDPKSLDYAGTSMEKLANDEKELSLVSFNLLYSLVTECMPRESENGAFAESACIICELHGCINMYHTNILKEIGVDISDVTKNTVHHILSDLRK